MTSSIPDTRNDRRRMKIAFIHQPWSVIQPPMNGADSVALLTDEIARRLVRDSCDVVAYCRLGKNQPRVEQHAGVEYRRASVSIDRWVKLGMQALDRRGLRDPLRPFFSSALCYRQFISQVVDDLAQQDCDVVHIHNFSQFIPVIRHRLPHIKIVIHMHCQWLNEIDAAVIEPRLEQADLILGVSDFIAGKVRAKFPQLANRCKYLHNGADLDRFAQSPKSDEKRVLFVGRLSPEKGVHALLDAFAAVLRNHPDAKLEIIGPEQIVPREMILPFSDDPKVRAMEDLYRPGAYPQLLQEKVAQLPAQSVSFINRGLDHSDLATHYAGAAVFALPSVWQEPCSMPLCEAMASGCAIVASRSGGSPELIEDGRSGLLVEPGDVASLAGAIDQLLSDPARRREFSGAIRARSQSRHSWEQVALNLLTHYRNIPSRHVAGTHDADDARPVATSGS